jgi:hypothetical protein
MKRRQVLLAFTGLTACGAIAAAGVSMSGEDEAVAAVIYKRLNYLNLDPLEVQRFARDFTARHFMSVRKLRTLSASRLIYDHTPQSLIGVIPGVSFGEDRIVTMFLMSSDFFPDRDESRVVRYLGIFDGQQRANPFARLLVQTV